MTEKKFVGFVEKRKMSEKDKYKPLINVSIRGNYEDIIKGLETLKKMGLKVEKLDLE